MLLCPISLPIW